jgi:hypothetical protein
LFEVRRPLHRARARRDRVPVAARRRIAGRAQLAREAHAVRPRRARAYPTVPSRRRRCDGRDRHGHRSRRNRRLPATRSDWRVAEQHSPRRQRLVANRISLHMHKPDSDAEASESGIFAEVVSISSTRSAGVSDSAYFIQSIELRPTFDLFLGARRGLHFFGRVSSAETLIVWWFCRTHRSTPFGSRRRRGRARRACGVLDPAGGVLWSLDLLGGDG